MADLGLVLEVADDLGLARQGPDEAAAVGRRNARRRPHFGDDLASPFQKKGIALFQYQRPK